MLKVFAPAFQRGAVIVGVLLEEADQIGYLSFSPQLGDQPIALPEFVAEPVEILCWS